MSAGTTNKPRTYRDYYSANLPKNKRLIAVGIAGSNDHVYYWWSNGTVSAGTTSNPTAYRSYYESGF